MNDDPWIGRWVVFRSVSMEGVEPGPPDEDGKRWWSMTDGETTGFVVRTGNAYSQTPEDYEVEFGSDEETEANELAEELTPAKAGS